MTTVALHAVPSIVAPSVMRAEIEALSDVRDVSVFAAKAEALRKVAGAIDKSGGMAREFAEVRLRAERRGGELLAAMPSFGQGKPDTLSGFGIAYHQSSRWQRVSSIPEPDFEAYIAAAHERDTELTTAGALKLAKRTTTTPVDVDQPAPAEGRDGAVYPTIVIDPPWRYDNVATRGAAEDHYPTMSLEDLAELDVPAADDAHIYLWVTNGFIRQGFDLLDAWDFTYKTTLTWCKPSIGMGNYFRNNTEHVLFGVRGKLPTLRNDVGTWFNANKTKHSAKPESFYDLVESCSPAPWFEMFSRRKRLGDWHVWGNESMGTLA